jgi:hypothetical protein
MPVLHFARYKHKHKFTHFLFRFPAKFHAPAVRCLINRYSKRGDTILDPFCGSGTLLVEALVSGRSAIGVDVDPVAVFVSRVKTAPVSAKRLKRAFDRLKLTLASIRRSSAEYDRLVHEDLSPRAIGLFRERLAIPPIPNIQHWFRIYVSRLARETHGLWLFEQSSGPEDQACAVGRAVGCDRVRLQGMFLPSVLDPLRWTLYERAPKTL